MVFINSLFHYSPIYLWKHTDVNLRRDYDDISLSSFIFNIFCGNKYRIKKYFKHNETIGKFKERYQITQKLFIHRSIPRIAYVSYRHTHVIPIPNDTDFLDETKTFDELGIKANNHIIIYDYYL
jgi:hypothetical protein